MKKKDLELGMVLKVYDESSQELSLSMVCSYKDGLCISGPEHWWPLKVFNDDLTFINAKVTEVYGFSNYCMSAYMLSTEDRPLLWKRDEEENEEENEKNDETVTITRDDLMDAEAKDFNAFHNKLFTTLFKDEIVSLISLLVCILFHEEEDKE